jgi:hypothetical protein
MVNYHRVLLGLLLDANVPTGPVLPGFDDTIERRRGKRISAKGNRPEFAGGPNC